MIGKMVYAPGILDYLPVEWTGGHLSIGMWADCRELYAADITPLPVGDWESTNTEVE